MHIATYINICQHGLTCWVAYVFEEIPSYLSNQIVNYFLQLF